jgi:DNA-binding NarL/FixJ family response regulator
MKHTILIAEDHPLLRLGLRAAVQRNPDYTVVGEVTTGYDAIQQTLMLRPDLLIMDMTLPDTGSIEVTQQIRRRQPGQKILAMSDNRSEIQVGEALRAGCSGYLLKDAPDEETMLAVRLVLSGGRFISHDLADEVLSGALRTRPASQAVTLWDRLSSRERAVFRLIAQGGTNRTAAGQLSLSPKTIEKHRASLMRKLNLRNAVELALLAVEMGLVDRPATPMNPPLGDAPSSPPMPVQQPGADVGR